MLPSSSAAKGGGWRRGACTCQLPASESMPDQKVYGENWDEVGTIPSTFKGGDMSPLSPPDEARGYDNHWSKPLSLA
ncbi:hypothetical protein HOLleu_30674 [Holothuria leucospilota]|uniref:Uncharacterized protein n=1 Tax=Holothuria leucospilota TaxID=206669 RepID=A0A9Q1BKX9_HOLLE|nr:hypothetical protein HOLleu_30674 [Holothuria leucospilota]